MIRKREQVVGQRSGKNGMTLAVRMRILGVDPESSLGYRESEDVSAARHRLPLGI